MLDCDIPNKKFDHNIFLSIWMHRNRLMSTYVAIHIISNIKYSKKNIIFVFDYRYYFNDF